MPMLADRLDGAGELGGGGHVGAEDAAGDQRLGDGLQALPGGEHVEDDAVDLGVAKVVLEVADGELPRGVRAAEVALDVLRWRSRRSRAALVASAACPGRRWRAAGSC